MKVTPTRKVSTILAMLKFFQEVSADQKPVNGSTVKVTIGNTEAHCLLGDCPTKNLSCRQLIDCLFLSPLERQLDDGWDKIMPRLGERNYFDYIVGADNRFTHEDQGQSMFAMQFTAWRVPGNGAYGRQIWPLDATGKTVINYVVDCTAGYTGPYGKHYQARTGKSVHCCNVKPQGPGKTCQG
ncbi:hypothetical protein BCR37DRAFT_53943 [Protomyces lactucae-debilis]|uniref:Uncharacterized protein n=1 Tax=Protomyces lactucae-debilis TaxID=2754530 RepID=A0A1Y2FD91_PROLT|nr:uncharacterized protein BCR37DRAFT_53943 [Protomyces lactucae-debilis]ORY80815.1 hypothetical protein BCR37DRAFT_53943 [Protomyces lactucae-debilis]